MRISSGLEGRVLGSGNVGVAVPDSSGMACVYAGGGGTTGAVKFEFGIIRELRVWTIRIWTDNLRPKIRISKRDYILAKGKKTHTESRDAHLV